MDLISIIVPVYNVEKYLPQCLDSIVNQTYKNLEIILVDDGSTDNSGKICDEYAAMDNRIVVIHKENGGVSSARNLGLENINGKGICFIDSDDTVEKNYIEELVKPWQEADYDLVVCNAKDIWEHHSTIRISKEVILNKEFKEDYWKLIKVLRVPWVKLYKTEIIKKNNLRFILGMRYQEDQMWNLSYYEYVKTYKYTDKVLYNYYHRNNESLSKLRDYETYKKILLKLNTEENFLKCMEIKNAKDILTSHALDCLAEFVLVSDIDNDYRLFKERCEELKKYVFTSSKIINSKKKILLKLVQYNFIYLAYLLCLLNLYGKRLQK